MNRRRRRYLALEIDSDQEFCSEELMHAVWNSALRLYGEYGASKMDLYLVTHDAQKRVAILRTTQDSVDLTYATLATITEVGGRPAAIHAVRVSGTIKALRKKMGWKLI